MNSEQHVRYYNIAAGCIRIRVTMRHSSVHEIYPMSPFSVENKLPYSEQKSENKIHNITLMYSFPAVHTSSYHQQLDESYMKRFSIAHVGPSTHKAHPQYAVYLQL